MYKNHLMPATSEIGVNFRLENCHPLSCIENLVTIAAATGPCSSQFKGPVYILGENCPRSNPDIAYMGYYLGSPMYEYV